MKIKHIGFNIWKLISGQSLFEVIFALSIAAMILVGVVSLAATSVRNATYSKNKTLANKYNDETAEWLKKQRNDLGWGGFHTQLGTTDSSWCMIDLSWSHNHACTATEFISSTIFKRQINVIAGSKSYTFTIVVLWVDSQGNHETVTTTVLTDWNQQ